MPVVHMYSCYMQVNRGSEGLFFSIPQLLRNTYVVLVNVSLDGGVIKNTRACVF